jgi:hypothetical protein
MKTNDNDFTIRQKLDGLDTLDGGIVFGREEAWEKLQGRMDKKPARKIGLYYGLAAAVLILFGCVLFLLRAPQPQLAHSHKAIQAIDTIPATEHASKPEPIAANTAGGSKSGTRTSKRNIAMSIAVAPTVIVELPAPAPIPEVTNDPSPVVANSTPAVRPAMRTVHINDLDNDIHRGAEPAAHYGTAVAIKSMKVVTMAEALKDGPPVMLSPDRLRNETSMPLVKVLFRQEQFTSRSNISAQNPFNIKINLQN